MYESFFGFHERPFDLLAGRGEVGPCRAPVHQGRARGGREKTGQHFHRGGFPGAVRAQEAEHLARPHFETQVIDGDEMAVALAQLPRLDGQTAH